jgi:hypothetical protein
MLNAKAIGRPAKTIAGTPMRKKTMRLVWPS